MMITVYRTRCHSSLVTHSEIEAGLPQQENELQTWRKRITVAVLLDAGISCVVVLLGALNVEDADKDTVELEPTVDDIVEGEVEVVVGFVVEVVVDGVVVVVVVVLVEVVK